MSYLNFKKAETVIRKAKEKLIAKGLYENFGQKEVREIQDKFDYNSLWINDACLSSKQIKTRRAIKNFNEWCMTYNGG